MSSRAFPHATYGTRLRTCQRATCQGLVKFTQVTNDFASGMSMACEDIQASVEAPDGDCRCANVYCPAITVGESHFRCKDGRLQSSKWLIMVA